jgi:hypothetical protein
VCKDVDMSPKYDENPQTDVAKATVPIFIFVNHRARVRVPRKTPQKDVGLRSVQQCIVGDFTCFHRQGGRPRRGCEHVIHACVWNATTDHVALLSSAPSANSVSLSRSVLHNGFLLPVP